MRRTGLLLATLLTCTGCLRPASERASLDEQVGKAQGEGVAVDVEGGLASIRSMDAGQLELWAQAPLVSLRVSAPGRVTGYRIDVHNCIAGSVLTRGAERFESVVLPERRASCRFELDLVGDDTLTFGPADAADQAPFAFAVLSDIQRGVDRVQDVFERMNEDPELRFVVSTGDLANTGVRPELLVVQRELESLGVPLYSTVGNHEMGASPRHWHELFGRFNPHFEFKGVVFSLIDSGNATVDPEVFDWLDGWLAEARDEVHVVLTHVPPLDPIGLRGGGFRSRKEAGKLLARLARGRVDSLFLGHIHSYYAFSAAGVPVYISGGGGAIQERLDGIERHYLKVQVTPGRRIDSVAVVRVD